MSVNGLGSTAFNPLDNVHIGATGMPTVSAHPAVMTQAEQARPGDPQAGALEQAARFQGALDGFEELAGTGDFAAALAREPSLRVAAGGDADSLARLDAALSSVKQAHVDTLADTLHDECLEAFRTGSGAGKTAAAFDELQTLARTYGLTGDDRLTGLGAAVEWLRSDSAPPPVDAKASALVDSYATLSERLDGAAELPDEFRQICETNLASLKDRYLTALTQSGERHLATVDGDLQKVVVMTSAAALESGKSSLMTAGDLSKKLTTTLDAQREQVGKKIIDLSAETNSLAGTAGRAADGARAELLNLGLEKLRGLEANLLTRLGHVSVAERELVLLQRGAYDTDGDLTLDETLAAFSESSVTRERQGELRALVTGGALTADQRRELGSLATAAFIPAERAANGELLGRLAEAGGGTAALSDADKAVLSRMLDHLPIAPMSFEAANALRTAIGAGELTRTDADALLALRAAIKDDVPGLDPACAKLSGGGQPAPLSDADKTALREMLRDAHPGIRLAMGVEALSEKNLAHLEALRDKLIPENASGGALLNAAGRLGEMRQIAEKTLLASDFENFSAALDARLAGLKPALLAATLEGLGAPAEWASNPVLQDLAAACDGNARVFRCLQSQSVDVAVFTAALTRGGAAMEQAVDTLLLSRPELDAEALAIKTAFSSSPEDVATVGNRHAAECGLRDIGRLLGKPVDADQLRALSRDLLHGDQVMGDVDLLVIRTYWQGYLANNPESTLFSCLSELHSRLGEFKGYPELESKILSNINGSATYRKADEQVRSIGKGMFGDRMFRRAMRRVADGGDASRLTSLINKTAANLAPARRSLHRDADRNLELIRTRQNCIADVAGGIAAAMGKPGDPKLIARLGKTADAIAPMAAALTEEYRALDSAAKASPPDAAAAGHLRVIAEMSMSLPRDEALISPGGTLKAGRLHSVKFAAGAMALADMLGSNGEQLGLAEKRAIVNGLHFDSHIDLATLRSGGVRVTPRCHMPRHGRDERAFLEQIKIMKNPGTTAAAFDAASTVVAEILARNKVLDKAGAILFLEATNRQLQGKPAGAMLDAAFGRSADGGPIAAIRGRMDKQYAATGTDGFVAAGSPGRRALRTTAEQNRHVMQRESRAMARQLGYFANRAVGNFARLAILETYANMGETDFKAMMDAATRRGSDEHTQCVERLKKYLHCDDDFAAAFIGRAAVKMSRKPSIAALDASTHPTLSRRVHDLFSSGSGANMEKTCRDVVRLVKPGTELAVDVDIGGNASVTLVPGLIGVTAGVRASFLRNMTIACEKPGEFTVTMMRGGSGGLTAGAADLGGIFGASLDLSGEAARGVELTFTAKDGKSAEDCLSAFLIELSRHKPARDVLTNASGFAAVTSVGGGATLSFKVSPMKAPDSADTYMGIKGKQAGKAADAAFQAENPGADPASRALTGAERAAGDANTAAHVMGYVLPFNLTAAAVLSASGETTFKREGDNTVTTISQHFSADSLVAAGLSTDSLMDSIKGESSWANDKYIQTTIDGRATLHGVDQAEADAKALSASRSGHRLGAAAKKTVHVDRDFSCTRRNDKVIGGGMTVRTTLNPLEHGNPQVARGLLKNAGVTNPFMIGDTLARLRRGAVTVVEKRELDRTIINRYAAEGRDVPLHVLMNADSYTVTGYALEFAEDSVDVGSTFSFASPASFGGRGVTVVNESAGFHWTASGERQRTVSYLPYPG